MPHGPVRPPATAVPLGGDDPYAALLGLGYGYGPAFRGLRAAHRDGGTLYAEVRLPDGVAPDTHPLHPALLDAVLHPLALGFTETRLPFSWSGVEVTAPGATALRAALTPPGTTGCR